jgi:hypothetical protein
VGRRFLFTSHLIFIECASALSADAAGGTIAESAAVASTKPSASAPTGSANPMISASSIPNAATSAPATGGATTVSGMASSAALPRLWWNGAASELLAKQLPT